MATMITCTQERGVELSDDAREWLENKYRAMNAAQRKRFAKTKKGLDMMDSVLRLMCERKLGPQAAAELLVKQLQEGTVQATGIPRWEPFVFPVSFWRALGQDGIRAAYMRGWFNRDECVMLWRLLGRGTDHVPEKIKFPALPDHLE